MRYDIRTAEKTLITVDAISPEAALRDYARALGYRDAAHAAECVPAFAAGLIVEPSSEASTASTYALVSDDDGRILGTVTTGELDDAKIAALIAPDRLPAPCKISDKAMAAHLFRVPDGITVTNFDDDVIIAIVTKQGRYVSPIKWGV